MRPPVIREQALQFREVIKEQLVYYMRKMAQSERFYYLGFNEATGSRGFGRNYKEAVMAVGSSAMCGTFKTEIIAGIHFWTPHTRTGSSAIGADTFKIAAVYE